MLLELLTFALASLAAAYRTETCDSAQSEPIELRLGDGILLQSVGYPGAMQRSCFRHIKAPKGSTLSIKFVDASLNAEAILMSSNAAPIRRKITQSYSGDNSKLDMVLQMGTDPALFQMQLDDRQNQRGFQAQVLVSSGPAVTRDSARSPRIGRVLQFSDFHYDTQYSEDGVPTYELLCHVNNSVQADHRPGPYGDYICDANSALIRHMLAAAKEIIPTPDYVLWTGDNFPHISGYNESVLEQTIQAATKFVDYAYPAAVILPAFGNHDYAPANAFPDSEHPLYRFVFNIWKHWIGDENQATFLKGGYYKYKIADKLIVLVLNTNLYYRFNGAYDEFQNKQDPADMFQFMIDNLESAKKNNQSVHIVSHMAPGVFERTPDFTWMRPEYNQRFIDITVQYATTIKWMIFGHHHTDTFHVVKDPATNKPVQVYFMVPAVTPWFSTLIGAGANNPAFRIYDYSTDTEELSDATTYYVDLDALNKDASTKWQKEYSMKDAYNIQTATLNAEAMNDVLNKLKTNDTVFMKYLQYNSVQHDVVPPLNESFRLAQLCSIEFPDFDGYHQCMQPGTAQPATTSEAPSNTVHLATAVSICLIALLSFLDVL